MGAPVKGGLLHRLRGQVLLEITCPYPERVLNLCSARGLAFWDLTWQGPEQFACRMSRHHAGALQRCAGDVGCTVRVLGRQGVPYALRALSRRPSLAVGAVICAAALTLGSFFIWDIQISGNTTVPKETILRCLEAQGVGIGAFGLSLDGESIRNHVLLELPQLSWIAVNVSGCRAQVQVRERRSAPALLKRTEPCNLVARRDALVLKVQALGGVKAVLPGMSVTAGQLLISGVEDTGTYGARLTAGLGTVQGRTWYDLTANVPLTGRVRRYTGAEKRLHSVTFGKKRIKFYFNSSIPGAQCDKITTRRQLHLLGIPLPVTWQTELCRPYTAETVSLPQAQRQEAVGAVLEAYLHTLTDPYGQVTATQLSSRLRGDILTVTLTAECREDIGVQVPIYTQDEPGPAPGQERE